MYRRGTMFLKLDRVSIEEHSNICLTLCNTVALEMKRVNGRMFDFRVHYTPQSSAFPHVHCWMVWA